MEDETETIATRRPHLGHFGATLRHFLDDDAGMLLVNVDGDFLDWFEQFIRCLVAREHDLGTRHGKLEAFTAHLFDENGQLQFTTTGDLHRILVVRLGDAERDVALAFLHETVADDAACDLVAFGAGKRRVINAELHRDGWRINRVSRKRLVYRRIAERVGDGALDHAGDRDNVARKGLINRHALKTTKAEHFGDAACLDEFAVRAEHFERLVRLDGTRGDAARDNAAEIGVCFENGTKEAESTFFDAWWRDVLDDEIEHRAEIGFRAVGRGCHPALFG